MLKKTPPDESKLPLHSSADQLDYHIPVLLQETIDGLQIKADGIYVDCTFGGGGHSRALLQHLGEKGILVAFDQDEDAKKNLPQDNRVVFVPQNFRHLQRFLRLHKITQVDGILADLGVSSHQFDEAGRGFSIRFDAALDMRMDQRQTTTAADIIKKYTELQLHKLLEQFGEVTNAKTLAKTIVQQRALMPIKTIQQFKQAVQSAVKGNPQKYFAQVFQALRIAVNDEFGVLDKFLQKLPFALASGGRVAILSFHSGEDRRVKKSFQGLFREGIYKEVAPDPIRPTAQESNANPRARSAKLRWAIKA